MKKKLIVVGLLILLLTLLLAAITSGAQEVKFDTTAVLAVKDPQINDYIMIGVNYGVSFCNMYYAPSRHNRAWPVHPNYISVMFTKHSKMFDIIPRFAVSAGVAHGYEGFAFKRDPDTGASQEVDGAEEATIEIFELPALAQFYYDIDPVKILAQAGMYMNSRGRQKQRGDDDSQEDQHGPFGSHSLSSSFMQSIARSLYFHPVHLSTWTSTNFSAEKLIIFG